jgi:hypothetical protein
VGVPLCQVPLSVARLALELLRRHEAVERKNNPIVIPMLEMFYLDGRYHAALAGSL